MNIFFIEYTVLLVAFLIAAYRFFTDPDGDKHHDGSGAMDVSKENGFLKTRLSRMSARRQASGIKE